MKKHTEELSKRQSALRLPVGYPSGALRLIWVLDYRRWASGYRNIGPVI